jgi:hypothetical protein
MSQEALGQVLSPLRKSQRTIISLVVQAMAALGQAASIPIAAVVAQRVGSQVDSALTRVYRLLHNRRLDDLVMSREMIRMLAKRTTSVLVALDWTQITTPEFLARFVVLIGLAVLLLTAVGHALSLKHAHVRLPSKTKGPRLSLLTVGLLFWPVLQNKVVINLKFLKTHLPPPTLRSFPWLDHYEKEI